MTARTARMAAAALAAAVAVSACGGTDHGRYRPAPCGTPEACAAEAREWAELEDAARRAGALRD